ncbi:MAG: putative bifunctional diguanylate cyclase/phosphodiesterase [Leptolyngbyaceae cyanobacterium]
MSAQPLPDDSSRELNRMLKRLMRRQGVAMGDVPNLANWHDFVIAIDQTLKECSANRKLLEQSVQSTSLKLKQTYNDLKTESRLRLIQADLHQRELKTLVQERTTELQNAQLHLEQVNQRLEYDATHDDLTGLANRNQLMQELNRYIAELGTEADIGLWFFFIDFDRFKQINDRFGHLIGDTVLIQVAHRLSALVGDAICLARLGGDEFVLLIDQLQEAEAVHLAQSITDAFAQPMRIHDTEILISASVGIVLADASYQSAEEVVRDADIAMYRAKATGNCYQRFDEAMRTEHLERIELERELEIAIREKQFCINFEPIIDTTEPGICSFESLVRWIHPEKGVISPGRFIPLAEELGLVVEIDRIVFEQTCAQFNQWRRNGMAGPDQKCNVNLSCSQLEKADIVPFLLSTIDGSNIRPQDVVLEITESYLLADSGPVIKNLNEINELGFSIFVDDFGTGYSSLSYLAKYPIHGIKIDRSFVRDLAERPQSRELIRSIIAMAEALNLKVVTEGVETVAQLQAIMGLGCRYIQGFLFTRPMNAIQVDAFLVDKPYKDLLKRDRIRIRARNPS